MSRYNKSSNPFEDDEQEDFVMIEKNVKPSASASTPQRSTVSKPATTSSQPSLSSSNKSSSLPSAYSQKQNQYASSQSYSYHTDEKSPFEDRRQHLLRQIENSENSQLESTQRALASIYDSEAMGIATAEELLRQGETLDNIETKTDGMQHNLKSSQRHLNNIKSVFGGIKNWWSGDKKTASAKPAEENANTRLRTTVEKNEKSKPDVRGFYDEDNDLDSRFMAGAPKLGSGQYTVIQPVTRSAREEEVDYNLGLMSDGMSKLKGLAMGLGDEIERQNEQLDRINVKVDRTDELLTHQNTQMKRILKK